jgi:hypothetical protein
MISQAFQTTYIATKAHEHLGDQVINPIKPSALSTAPYTG